VATAQMNAVIRHLRRAVLLQDGAGRTDGELLESFINQKDEAAFAALVRRHGQMVLAACRRVVHNHHDAEDAFQATFLVLARKASSVRPSALVANWLHGVAYRTALKARTITAKRQLREKQVTAMPEPKVTRQDHWHDLEPLLDEELSGLPETYRLPILLCDLECKSIKEATRQLGWPQGTLAGRLARGRKMLAKRLARRGLALSGGSLAALVAQNVASGSVPPSLMISTVKLVAAGQAAVAGLVPAKVAALMEGVLKAMLLTKLKTVAAVLSVLGMVAFGGGLLKHQRATGQQAIAQEEDAKPKSQIADIPNPDAGKNQAFRVEVVPGTGVQRFAVDFQDGPGEPKVEQRPGRKVDPARSKAEAPKQAEPANVGKVEYTQPFSIPSAEEVLRALPKGQPLPRNPRIKCELVGFRLEAPKFFPIVGPAQLATVQFKCTVTNEQGKDVVVYIEKEDLINAVQPRAEPNQESPAKATEGKRVVVPMALDFGFPVKPMNLDFGFPVKAMESKQFIVPLIESQEEYRVPLIESEEEYRVPLIESQEENRVSVLAGEGKRFVVQVTEGRAFEASPLSPPPLANWAEGCNAFGVKTV
jgi:RNA polymerase sigma factor (sigma-70 family)